jgi:hypothetical protein
VSLADQISALATRVAQEFNSVRTALAGKVDTSDARLTNARTPTAHASTHHAGGGDAITPASIGASTSGHSHSYVSPSRTIATTAPLTGGGDLSANRNIGIAVGTTAGTVAAGNDARFTPAVVTLPEQTSLPTAAADAEQLFAVDVNGITSFRAQSPSGLVTDIQRDNSIIARNETGSTIAKGAPVYITGPSATAYGLPATHLPLIAPARANQTSTMPAIGVALQSIATGAAGRVLRYGMLTGVDTSAYAAGARLWVSTNAAGQLSATEPVDRVQRIGIVVRVHATDGQILIDPRAMAAIAEGTLVPAGGSAGQVLTKSGAGNWDVAWADFAAPRALSVTTATANVDVGAAGDVQITLSTVTATTLTPTNGQNGRTCVVEVLAATGATRTPTWASSVKLTDGITSLGLAIPAGRVGVFVLRCSTITGSTVYELASSYLRAA